MASFVIFGSVVDKESTRKLENLRVEAWDKDLICDDLVGNATTNSEGEFRIEFDETFFQEAFLDPHPDLFFKVFDGSQLIASTENSVVWNINTASTKVVIEVHTGRTEASTPLSIQLITGFISNADNGYSIAGLSVKAYLKQVEVQQSSQASNVLEQAEVFLGESSTDANGRFVISLEKAQLVPANSHIGLTVASVNGQVYASKEVAIASSSPIEVTLPVSIPIQPVAESTWQVLGERMETARLARLHDLAHQLTSSDPSASIFADWSLEQKQSALMELETAFLDPEQILRNYAAPPSFKSLKQPDALEAYKQQLIPHSQSPEVRSALTDLQGKLSSFDSLLDVDWVINVNALKQGSPAAAIASVQNLYRPAPFDFSRISDRQRVGEATADSIPYRDYLRSIWERIAKVSSSKNSTEAIDQINQRFHQDFQTEDLTERPANEILIDIVREILVAPTGNSYGFGINPSTIEARGTRSAQQYLDYLIQLTSLSTREFGLRYRLNVERSESEMSTAVDENIYTLQHFFCDSFQSDPEPFLLTTEVYLNKAPFFLKYEEWLQNKAPFYPENHYSIYRAFDFSIKELRRDYTGEAGDFLFYIDLKKKLDNLNKTLQQGYQSASSYEFEIALSKYQAAFEQIVTILNDPGFHMGELGSYHFKYAEFKQKYVSVLRDTTQAVFTERRNRKLANIEALDYFTQLFQSSSGLYSGNYAQAGLIFLIACILPVALGDLALMQGDYYLAVSYYNYPLSKTTVGMAGISTSSPYYDYFYYWGADLYTSGELAYTFSNSEPDPQHADDPAFLAKWVYPNADWVLVSPSIRANLLHPMEKRFLRLRLGNAMLEWADALYRTDDEANKARARELYKGVLLLHGEMPAIAPSWSANTRSNRAEIDIASRLSFLHHQENPAVTLQKNRARLGFSQLEAGLNYFGYANDEVPILRYRVLKDTADRLAAAAKSAQTDFLTYVEKIEELFKERLLINNLVRKTQIQAQIVDEQVAIAQYGVGQAEKQLQQVEAAIAAKQKEIEEHDSFWGQLGDYVSGFKKALGGVPDEGKSFAKEGVTAGGEGAAAGAGVLGAYAAFVYCSYVSMSAMEDAANQRLADLNTLREQALPAAKQLIRVKQRDVKIAELQGEIVRADADLAQDLIAFQSTRFLNVETWSQFAGLMNRLLRRYLDLAAQIAWLAERALAYEQARSINLIRLDYFPLRSRGVTGADLLQLDLAELEASRINNLKQKLPIKHTFSLSRDFPVQFAQLKQTGSCTFRTSEQFLQNAYPGTYSYRLKTVTIAVECIAAIPPVRGVLINQGISIVSGSNDERVTLISPSNALALSEFQLRDDLTVYNLTNELLMTFEGSGVETFWELQLPAIANPYGLSGVTDILITLDVYAQFSRERYEKHITDSSNKSVRRFILVPASKNQAHTLKTLRDKTFTGTASFEFDLDSIGLPKEETNRKITNITIFLVSKQLLSLTGAFSIVSSSINQEIKFENGTAYSNAPLETSHAAPTPTPLNTFVGQDVEQIFRLAIEKSKFPALDFNEITDVVLGVEYSANLSK